MESEIRFDVQFMLAQCNTLSTVIVDKRQFRSTVLMLRSKLNKS